MRYIIFVFYFLLFSLNISAQQLNNALIKPNDDKNSENIYAIKKQFLEKVLHNPNDKNMGESDNDLARFNRWYNFIEPRCYPTGNMPRPDVLLKVYERVRQANHQANKTTSGATSWQPLGPNNVPAGFFGIGRVDCITINPQDTNTLYIGAACGGVWISHDRGLTWATHTDGFPSLSVADIAVNPNHPDTLYAATGDGYGYEVGANIFWGGLYSAGVMKSVDGGNSWHTSGLSYLQSNNDIIQRLLIHPNNPNILLAATRHGIYRTSDGGVTWALVDTGHVFSMAFHPLRPDTVYAINATDLRISYDAGITWNTQYYSINSSGDRCTIAVSDAAPSNIWVLDDFNNLKVSNNEGITFFATGVMPPTYFYGYYDRVLGVSPINANFIVANGMDMNKTIDGGFSWNPLDASGSVHPDNHAIVFNPLNSSTFYTCNDGGVWVTNDLGNSWSNLSNGLTISQIYRMSSSVQNPNIMLCGLQDNGNFYNDGTNWVTANISLGDGMDNAISPLSDSIQVGSTQNGNFSLSNDKGNTFTNLSLSAGGSWTAPIVMDPHNRNNVFFGLNDVWATYDMGLTFVNLTNYAPFTNGAISLAIAPSNSNVLYAADYSTIITTTDGGATWADVTGSLPVLSVPITGIAIDYTNPMNVYITMSGYMAGQKVFYSSTGGVTWTNISGSLPNIPADCIATDSTTPGAIFVGTDIGVYYKDNTLADWIPYFTGLPNVIVDDIDINYTNKKVRVATYGRGVWECDLKQYATVAVKTQKEQNLPLIQVEPNPSSNYWKIVFAKQKPANYIVKVMDKSGRVVKTYQNTDKVDASKLSTGVYTIDVFAGGEHFSCQAVKE